jgi:hypothetical protein
VYDVPNRSNAPANEDRNHVNVDNYDGTTACRTHPRAYLCHGSFCGYRGRKHLGAAIAASGRH